MRALLYLIITLLFISCQSDKSNNRFLQGGAFGTSFSVLYNAPIEEELVRKGIDSVINVFNQSVSTYHPESLISRINSGDSTVVVDDIFKEVFFMSKIVYENTNGYFDPTVGVLRNAYGFGEEEDVAAVTQKKLDSLMTMVGFDKVHFREDHTISKDHPMIYLDFNAIAKGYGVDRIAAFLESLGITNYLVEIGGELYGSGLNPERNAPWSVGIEAVDSELGDRTYTHAIPLHNAGMAASGNYRKFKVDPESGKKFVHTINPLTGSAEQTDVTSATVIAESCALADAYATAFMALGLEKSKLVLDNLDGVQAYLTYLDKETEEENGYATAGMKLLLAD